MKIIHKFPQKWDGKCTFIIQFGFLSSKHESTKVNDDADKDRGNMIAIDNANHFQAKNYRKINEISHNLAYSFQNVFRNRVAIYIIH